MIENQSNLIKWQGFGETRRRGAVFSVYCATVAAEVLLGPTNIEAVLSSGGELAVEYRCSCGERGSWKRGKGEPDVHTQAVAS